MSGAPPLSEAETTALRDEAISWAAQHGLLVATASSDAGATTPAAFTHAPVALLPTPFPRDVFELAPQIITLCSGQLQPFDFGLVPAQHQALYQAGQLFTHLYAAAMSGEEGPRVMSDEQKLKALLWVLRLDYP